MLSAEGDGAAVTAGAAPRRGVAGRESRRMGIGLRTAIELIQLKPVLTIGWGLLRYYTFDFLETYSDSSHAAHQARL